MSFANPLGLLLLLSLPVIVVLHLFRQERRRQEVSSIYLWREISDQHSRRMRPRLLRNLNLLLQLAFALFAALALAQPLITTGAVTGSPEMILMIDDSASMQTNAGGVTHMALARNRAREIVGRAPRSVRIMVVSAGPRPTVVQTFTSDRALLYEQIGSLDATDGAGDLDGALRLVRGLRPDDETEVVFVTDGALSLGGSASLPRNLSPAIVGEDRVQNRLANRAITTFELRSRPDGSALEVLAAVANFSDQSAEVELRLSADNEVISTRRVVLDADEERLVTAVIPRTRGTLYTAELLDNEDALGVDDRAFAAASDERPVRIQLVTRGNLFLESFLSIYPNAELTVTETVDRTTPFDILILDDAPAPAGLRGNVVALGSAVPDGPFTPEATVQPDQAVSVRADHPVTRGVSLDQVQVNEVVAGRLNPRATTLASVGEHPLLYAYRTDSLTLVGTTFSLTSSDIALRGSFPVLMHNILEWLAPVSPTRDVGYTDVGDVVSLYVPAGENVAVIQPDGTPLRFIPRTTPFEFSDTDQSGVYEVRGQSFVTRFAVSLVDSDESDLTYRLGSASGGEARDVLEEGAGRPIRQWLALLALLLLGADWIVWARRH